MAKRKFGDRFEDAPASEDVTELAFGLRAPTYSPNADITRVAEDLIARFGTSLGHLQSFRIIYLRRASSRTDNEFHPLSASGAFIRSDRERAIRGDIDAGVWVQGHYWDRFDPVQRQAWLHSLLLRFGMTPKGAIRLIRPDVSEWAEVARLYGAWADQLVLFREGLVAHDRPAPTPAAIARRDAAATTNPVN